MMKKKLLSGFAASAVSVSLLAGVSTATLAAQAFDEADNDDSILVSTQETSEAATTAVTQPQETIETTTTAVTQPTETAKTETTTTTTAALSEQQIALEKLTKKEKRLFGEFRRERAVILGDLSPDSARLTLDEVNEIIKDSNSYDEICDKLNAAQPYADYFGGSGVSIVEYWFDDNGSEKIQLILEQEDILYAQCAEDGSIKNYQLLYPVEKQINPAGYQTMIIDSYTVDNDIGLPPSTDIVDEAPSTTTETAAVTQSTEPAQSETTTTTLNTDKLIDEQQAALNKLTAKEKLLFGEFQRERAVILGDLSPDSARLTLDEVNEFIESSNSYDEIYEKLKSAQVYPDYFGGSGVSLVEYWFDDNGSQKIELILEQEDIFYVQCAEDGSIEDYQLLYPVEKQINLADYQAMMISSYKVYNDIDTPTTNTDHISLDNVKKIISENKTFNEICEEIKNIQNEPDASYGSGVGLNEYWLNDNGSEYILIMSEQSQIYHVFRDGDSTLLYDEKAAASTPDHNNNPVDTLPQTGYSNIYKAIAGLAAFMTVSGTAIVVKTRKENE